MKLLLAAGAALTLAVLPAFAGSTTVEFSGSDGQVVTIVFNDDGTSTTNGGAPTPYTMDQDAKTVCGKTPDDGDICATFDELGDEVGFSTHYTDTGGHSGTATITAKD